MFRATVGKVHLTVTEGSDGPLIDGEPLIWDLVEVSPGSFHILHKNKSYRALLVEEDLSSKTFVFRINGRNYSVVVKDKLDQLLEKMGMNNSTAGKMNNIKAPMPGLIVDLKVTVGAAVKAGDALLILEAMKMENVLKAPGDGTVKTVKVKKGDSVEKGEILIEF